MARRNSTPARSIELRPYQRRDLEALLQKFTTQAVARVLYVLPTGAGKTIVASNLIKSLLLRKERLQVLFVAHRRELVLQSCNKLVSGGISNVGMLMGGRKSDKGAAVLIATVQSASTDTALSTTLKGFDPGLIVIDEAHHTPAETYQKLLLNWPNASVLGMTATPFRTDLHGLGKFFQELHVGPQINELIESGYLANARVFSTPPESELDLSTVRIQSGDLARSDLERLMNKKPIIGNIVSEYMQRAEGMTAILYAVNVNHSKALCRAFLDAGLAAAHVDGNTPQSSRDSMLTNLESGTLRILCNCDLITEGLDVPSVGAIILARPTYSWTLYRQMVGRGLRPHPGKDSCIVLDHVGNAITFGHPCRPVRIKMGREEPLQDWGGSHAAPSRKPREDKKFYSVDGKLVPLRTAVDQWWDTGGPRLPAQVLRREKIRAEEGTKVCLLAPLEDCIERWGHVGEPVYRTEAITKDILRAVLEIGERCKAAPTIVTRVLSGEMTPAIEAQGLDRLGCYGALQIHKKIKLNTWVSECERDGLLERTVFGARLKPELCVTNAGMALLQGNNLAPEGIGSALRPDSRYRAV